MKVLISNDDGYHAEGITVLIAALEEAGHDVVVFAPGQNRSGSGMSITLRESIRVQRVKNNHYIVHGSPVDCVNIGLTSELNKGVDVVVSGINNGANLGDDSLYSGTIAAVIEARNLALPGIAVSVTSAEPKHYQVAADQLCKVLDSINEFKSYDLDVINLNIPDLPESELKGIEMTQLSSRKFSEPAAKQAGSNGECLFKIGGVGEFKQSSNQETFIGSENAKALRYDYEVVNDGYVSLTPIKAQFQQPAIPEELIASLK